MNILSLSGGKDSVASYFLCRHEIDCIIYVDSGVDFPSIKKTALMIGSDFASRGGRFEILSFDFFSGLCRYGWPSNRCRWCTSRKVSSIKAFKRSLGCDVVSYVGIAFDEQHRCKPGVEYPLVKAGMTEKQALHFCYSQGVDFGGVYDYFDRSGCFCCPLGGKRHFRRLFQYDHRLFQYVGVLNEYAALSSHPRLSSRFSFEEIRDLCESQLSFYRLCP